MKIAFITDIHFGCRNDNKFISDRLVDFLDNLFFPYLKKHGINHLFILGDTFDKRQSINFNTLQLANNKFFRVLDREKIKTWMLIGNHDIFYKNTSEINSPELIVDGVVDNINVIGGRFSKIVLDDGFSIGLVNWIHESQLNDTIDWIKSVEVDLLCGHFAINGFYEVSGHECSNGLSKSTFSNQSLVFSGHFHQHAFDGKILYIGNPQQTTWSDYNSKKGFVVLDTATKEWELIENKNTAYEMIKYNEPFTPSDYKNKIVRLLANGDTDVESIINSLNNIAHQVEIKYEETKKQIEVKEENEHMTVLDRMLSEINESKFKNKNYLKEYIINLYKQSESI